MKQYLVKDVMTTADKVVTISSFASVRELLKLMEEKHVKTVIVERANKHDAYGIVTYSNILNAIYTEDGDMDLLNVYDVCTKPLIQVVPELDIKYAAQLMNKQKITRLSVTWEGDLAGIITMTDIVKILMREANNS